MARPYIDDKVNHKPFLQAAIDHLLSIAGGGGPHTHEQVDITGLGTALAGKEDDGTADAAVAAHAGAADPHTIYLTLAEADALYEDLGAVAAHEGVADPHPVYLRQSEADLLYEAAGAVAAHAGAADPHPGYLTPAEANAAYEALGAVATHAAAADPHTGYQKESEKNNANGYAGLTASALHFPSQIPFGSAANTVCQGNDARLSDARTPTAHAASHHDGAIDPLNVLNLDGYSPFGSTVFLRGDGVFAVPSSQLDTLQSKYQPAAFPEIIVAVNSFMVIVKRLIVITTRRLVAQGSSEFDQESGLAARVRGI